MTSSVPIPPISGEKILESLWQMEDYILVNAPIPIDASHRSIIDCLASILTELAFDPSSQDIRARLAEAATKASGAKLPRIPELFFDTHSFIELALDVLKRPAGAPATPKPAAAPPLLTPSAAPLDSTQILVKALEAVRAIRDSLASLRYPERAESPRHALIDAMELFVRSPWTAEHREQLARALRGVPKEDLLVGAATSLLREPWPLQDLMEQLKSDFWPGTEDARQGVRAALTLARAGGGFPSIFAALAAEISGDDALVREVEQFHLSHSQASHSAQKGGKMSRDDLGTKPDTRNSRAILKRGMLALLQELKGPQARVLESRLSARPS